MLQQDQLKPILGTSLLYPCCGDDLEEPLRLFGSSVSDFFFVDTRSRPPDLPGNLKEFAVPVARPFSSRSQSFQDLATDNIYRLNRWTRRGESAFDSVSKLGVFFHRGDTLAAGEGSSGVPWLGRYWLGRILDKLVVGGFIVTDGSNCPLDGPQEMRRHYWKSNIGADAVSMARDFTYQHRNFTCLGYAGEGYGPTLIWQVT
jgi:hypothetical protein